MASMLHGATVFQINFPCLSKQRIAKIPYRSTFEKIYNQYHPPSTKKHVLAACFVGEKGENVNTEVMSVQSSTSGIRTDHADETELHEETETEPDDDCITLGDIINRY